jgi:DNA polymerase III epsilon subunit-like protein
VKPSILYLDFETTGLDSKCHGIVQAAWIGERDGTVLMERSFDVYPGFDADFNLHALDVNGFDLPRIKNGKSLSYILTCLNLDLHEVAFSSEKVRVCGHNVRFDMDFLQAACVQTNTKLWEIDWFRPLDTRSLAIFLEMAGRIPLVPNFKLELLCSRMGIPINAHDALEDIRATRALFHRLMEIYEQR